MTINVKLHINDQELLIIYVKESKLEYHIKYYLKVDLKFILFSSCNKMNKRPRLDRYVRGYVQIIFYI